MVKNNKGFMLAEVVITSTVVLTAMVSLYALFTRLYNVYNVRESYYNIDGMYAIKGIVDNLLSESDDNNFNNIVLKLESGSNYEDVINVTSCSYLVSSYKINHAYIIKYDSNMVSTLSNNVTNQTFKDYLAYVKNYYDFTDNEYTYLFVIEYGSDTNEGLYYSSMGIG